MGFRKALYGAGFAVSSLAALYAFQRPFRQFPGVEYFNFETPPDWNQPGEWAFARLMYPPASGRYGRGFGFGYGFRGSFWTEGNSMWTQDYPRADRHFSLALRRLTRIQVRSVEQPVNLDQGAAFDWPWLYAVQPGHWQLTDAQARTMREYLLRGGFFMADDFWGPGEWEVFMMSMRKVFPERQVVELQDSDPIFHTVYNLDHRYQVASEGSVQRGRSWKCEGCPDRWRGIFDDHGRLMVAITWEWADAPYCPEKYAALGIRIGVNYVVYAMTH